MTTTKRFLMAVALCMATASATPVLAQTGSGTGTTDNYNTANDSHEDDGFDWGWLGLLGLAGLIPRKRHEVHHDVHRTTTTTPGGATTSRTGV